MNTQGLPGFLAGAYGITWGGILALWAIRGFDLAGFGRADIVIVFACMLLGPSLAGIVQTWRIEGAAGVRALFGRASRWRVGWRWYAVALGTTPALLLPILAALAWTVDPVYRPRFEPGLFAIGLLAGAFEKSAGPASPRRACCATAGGAAARRSGACGRAGICSPT